MDPVDFLAALAETMPPLRVATDAEGRDCWAFEHPAFGYLEAIAGDDEALLVSPLPVVLSDAEVLKALLEGTAQGAATGAGAIAIHPVHGPALVTAVALAGLDETGFDRAVGGHLMHARMWHEDEALTLAPLPPEAGAPDEVILHL